MIIYDKHSSYRRKYLFLIMILIYKACYPTILNLSIVKKKIRLELLDSRHKINYICLVCGFVYYMRNSNFTPIFSVTHTHTHTHTHTTHTHTHTHTHTQRTLHVSITRTFAMVKQWVQCAKSRKTHHGKLSDSIMLEHDNAYPHVAHNAKQWQVFKKAFI